MYETVTVDEALARGKKTINYPIAAIQLLTVIASFFLMVYLELPGWTIAVGFLTGFIITWVYWSFMITRWRIWAFENVRNVHELKQRAIKEKLIWKDGSIFEKTEIRTTADKEKLNLIQLKFNVKDVFADDYSIPVETRVYYSKKKSLPEMILLSGCLGLGIYFIIATETKIGGAVLCLAALTFLYIDYRIYTNKKPQIMLNDKGIQTSSTSFYSWNRLANEEVKWESTGKNSNYYLTYDYPGGSERLLIDNLDTNKNDLEKLMRVYRGRWESKHNLN
ncbi:hypothetical protein KXD93_29775 [Mucilaginibacter sp. BJC16-A38]|uniref:hypothetical protein n=1 Tax=Mucilaginibacter phenanthrenivorans TaxID=1234842 RepID=UPI002157F6A4|nr:hypothetical protein [Mucilaginibacter phenanthrenivorans]MCR8561882.1 hypothetical protein [Mucilaginibacter phenanthrenivorans]